MWHYVYDAYDAPVTNMFDLDNVEVTDPDEAVKLVASLPNGKWLATVCERRDLVWRPAN